MNSTLFGPLVFMSTSGLTFLFLLVLPIEVVLLGFAPFSFSHPLEVVIFSILKLSSFTHPLRGSNVVRFDIWFEIPSFTHP
jgi:hypothetical protein